MSPDAMKSTAWQTFRFIVLRTLRGLIALFLLITFLFFFTRVFVPYDFSEITIMTRAAREALRQRLGLDLPLMQQYWNWIRNIFADGFGRSYWGYTVLDSLRFFLPMSMFIFLTGTIISFLLGQWLGKVTAWKGSGFFSGSVTFSAIALYTAFPPWLGFLMFYFFFLKLRWLRPVLHSNPWADLTFELWEGFHLIPNQVASYVVLSIIIVFLGLVTLNIYLSKRRGRGLTTGLSLLLGVLLPVGLWYLLGMGPQALDMLHLGGLPILTYVFLSVGETMIIMQTTMRDTMTEAYITTARAKGLAEHIIRDKHASRLALIPVLSRLVVSIPYLMTGMVIIERALDWPGMGEIVFTSLYNMDLPIVLGYLLVFGIISMIARFTLELLQVVLDPRLKERMTKW